MKFILLHQKNIEKNYSQNYCNLHIEKLNTLKFQILLTSEFLKKESRTKFS